MANPTAARHLVNFITGNANKLHEVQAILEPTIKVESQALHLTEIQGTLEEVTRDKCRRAAELVCHHVPPLPKSHSHSHSHPREMVHFNGVCDIISPN